MKAILIFLPFIFSSLLFAQNGELLIHYGIAMENPATAIKKAERKPSPEEERKLLNIYKTMKSQVDKLIFELHTSSAASVFSHKRILTSDGDKMINLMAALAGTNGIIYMNTHTQEIIEEKNVYGEDFIVTSKLDKYKWVLQKETKKINDYVCYKATTVTTVENPRGIIKKNVTAWYCPELAASHGPNGYGGLPGLILALEDENFLYYVRKIEIIRDTEKYGKIEKPVKGKKVTEKEFNDISKGMYKRRKGNEKQ